MTDEPARPEAPVDPAIDFEVLTLFPEFFTSVLSTSLLGKAVAAGLVRVTCSNFRSHGVGKHRSVDDSPYGGGPGMVLRPEPLAGAIEEAEALRGPCHRVILSPQGRPFDQAIAHELVARPRVMLICGRYEGFDQRVIDLFAHDVLSIGDFVLSGGEVAAAVVIEAVTRLVPGVLGKSESTVDESFAAGRLEYPHWTRPPEFRGLTVPEVLSSGDHAAIAAWRRQQSLLRTRAARPDLLARHPLTPAELRLLAEKDGGGE